MSNVPLPLIKLALVLLIALVLAFSLVKEINRGGTGEGRVLVTGSYEADEWVAKVAWNGVEVAQSNPRFTSNSARRKLYAEPFQTPDLAKPDGLADLRRKFAEEVVRGRPVAIISTDQPAAAKEIGALAASFKIPVVLIGSSTDCVKSSLPLGQVLQLLPGEISQAAFISEWLRSGPPITGRTAPSSALLFEEVSPTYAELCGRLRQIPDIPLKIGFSDSLHFDQLLNRVKDSRCERVVVIGEKADLKSFDAAARQIWGAGAPEANPPPPAILLCDGLYFSMMAAKEDLSGSPVRYGISYPTDLFP